jgi:glutamate dehydrogenase (NADP+)
LEIDFRVKPIFGICLGANFPTTPEAMEYFKNNGVILGPAIAANAGL